MSKQGESRGFLNRWSARKQAAEKDPVDVSVDALLPGDAGQGDFPSTLPPREESGSSLHTGTLDVAGGESVDLSSAQLDQPAEQPLLSDADMPPIESLTASSDVSAFFSKGVSAALRKAALRHVFQQPSYNVRDGLNDYDGDFTSYEPLGDTITSDMKFHTARKEKARVEAQAEAEREAEKQALEEARLEDEQLAADEPEAEDTVVQAETEEGVVEAESDPSAAYSTDSNEAEAEAEKTVDHGPDIVADDDKNTRNQDSAAG